MTGRSCYIVGVWEELPKEVKFKIRFEDWLGVRYVKTGGKNIRANESAWVEVLRFANNNTTNNKTPVLLKEPNIYTDRTVAQMWETDWNSRKSGQRVENFHNNWVENKL